MQFLVKGLVVLMFSLLIACGSDQADDQPTMSEAENPAALDDHEKAYKAKVNKRMKNAAYKSAVKELGKFGVSEQQVKCILEDHSYYQLSSQKNTPEIQNVFEDCGVSVQQLKGWYD